MRTKTILTLCSCWAVLALTGCDTKDPIHNTPHPDYGTITLTTDWSGIGEGLTPPTGYTVTAADYSATLSGATNLLDHLFKPGDCHINVYNTPEQITVIGSTATVAEAAGNADGAPKLVHNTPGWLFTSTMDVAIDADKDYAFTATMQQQVRQLTLIIEPTGDTADKIESITGTLSGIASSLNFVDGTHAAPANVALTFSKITSGEDAGRWSATVRLLGTAGIEQQLVASIAFTDGNPMPVTLRSDLTADLATFNTEKGKPLTLGSKLVVTPSNMGLTATLNNWKVDDKETGTAE